MPVRADTSVFRVRMGQIAGRLRDKQPLYQDVKGRLELSVQQNFRAEGRPTKWAPLQPATIAARRRGRRKGGRARILRDTGRLAGSIIGRIAGDSVIVGTNVIYAPTHQFGRGRIPARPFLLLQVADLRYIRNRMQQHIRGR